MTKTLVPAREDGYFDIAHYDMLAGLVESWRTLGEIPAERIPDAETTAACGRLLALEARLIDAGRLDDWLALYTDDCVYWLPCDIEGRNASAMVAWEMNDRRRLEERVERLASERAYSQLPPSRTTHLYTNIEVMTAEPGHVHVLAQFLIQTNRAGRISQRAGWNGYVLRKVGAVWRIVVKRINLQDADLPQDNNSFTL